MKLPTLEEFIVQATESWPHNSYVKEPGFASLYVRISKRNIEGQMRTVLDIANITAKNPGSGAFTTLVAKLRKEHPELGIYVECVLNLSFARMLENKLGFKATRSRESFYLI